ncbi:MAG: InlB B-repeat-containing protein, partial [Actinomycetota bacterium]
MKNQYISRLRKAIPVVLVLGLFTSVFVGVPNAFAASYSVTYNGNGQTGGTPPSDPGAYASGNTVNVLGQNGLYKTGYTFGGWSMPTGMGPQVISSFTILTDTTLTAVWNLATFSVTYSGNGNTGGSVPIDNASYSFGTTVTVAGQNGLTRTGYTFGGWSYSGGLAPSVVTSFSIQTNTTLTAVWNASATLTVTYRDDGKTSGAAPIDPNTYSSGATVTVLGAGTLVKAGYSFGGWTDCVINHLYGATFTILGNTVVCPVWTINPYAVHYLATGSTYGTPPSDPNSPYVSGATVTVLGAGTLLKTGYHFGGWKDADTHITTGPTFIILKVTDLDPVWIPDTYTVTYDGNCSNSCGAVPIDPTAYSPNSPVTVGAAPASNYPGFHFSGWALGGLAVYQPGQTFPITSNTVLTAVWVANVTYTVTYFPFQTTSGTPPVDILNPYSSGDVVFVLGAGTLLKTGYTFNGWSNCPAITTVGTSFVIHGDTTLCSLWIANPKFKVTYNGNGNTGGSVPNPTVGSGSATLASNSGSLVKSGSTFGGWNTKANGLGVPYAVGSSYNLMADVTLYAVWTPAQVIYRITYKGNGETGGSAPNPTTGAGSVLLATNSGNLVKSSNHIGGWNTKADGSGVTYLLGTSYNLIANVTVYALWLPNTYTITYDGNGATGGVVPNPTVGSGSVTLAYNSGALVKSGNSYANWNTAADGSGTTYVVGSTYSLIADVTLYAVWVPKTFTVTYNGNGFTGGSAPIDPTGYLSGGTVVVSGPNTLVKTGFTFGGWALGGLVIYAPGQTFSITSDVTLTAVWNPNIIYTITYNGNGFSSGAVPSPTVGSGLVTLATNSGSLIKSGFTFGGWNTAIDGSGTPYAVGSPYTLNANITLFATWFTGINSYTITYLGNGFTGGSVPSPTVGSGSVILALNSGSL